MQNPILQKLGNPNLNNIKQMMNMVKAAKDPQAMLNQMMANNPHYKQAVDYVNQNGGDPKKAFYALAKENGMNPDEIMSMFR